MTRDRQSDRITWGSPSPDVCQLCGVTIGEVFIDASLHGLGWALVCPGCHHQHGKGLGTGRGQKYEKQGEEWVKVEG